MPKGKTQQKSAKGVPRKARSTSRKNRRLSNRERQPERKLRHILAAKRGLIPLAKLSEARAWADTHNHLSTLRGLLVEMGVENA